MAARRRALSPPEPLLLAIETSGALPSVALLRGAALVAERRTAPGRPGREPLLPAIDALLRSTPTREGYDLAARLWTIFGEPGRAKALESQAQQRF